MGWSCSKRASDVVECWTRACLDNSDTQNTFTTKGSTYFWDIARTEHGDGAITGTIWRNISDTHCIRSGSFRIEGDGTITRAPKFLKDAAFKYRRVSPAESAVMSLASILRGD